MIAHEKQVIFILDDEKQIRNMLKEYLGIKIPNVDLYTFSNFIEMMEHPMLEYISLLIIDIELHSEMKGYDIVEELFSKNYDIPYLFMSGLPYDFDYFKDNEYTYDFIKKPVDLKKLLNRITVLLKVSNKYLTTGQEIINKQNFLDNILEQSPHATWISDMDGYLIRCNKALRDKLKVSNEDLVGHYNVFEDKIMIKNNLIPQIKKVYEQGQILNLSIEWDGNEAGFSSKETVFFDGTMFPIYNSDGKITNTVCSWIDITREKMLEKETKMLQLSLKDLFDHTNIYLVILDKEMNIKLCSYKLAHDLGFKCENELLGQKFNQFLYDEDKEKMMNVHSNVIKNTNEYQKQMREVTNKIITKTNSTIEVKWFNSRIQNGDVYTFSMGIPYNRTVSPSDDIESIRAYWKHVIDKDDTTLKALQKIV
jgi:PAS domain S-box-containing protein